MNKLVVILMLLAVAITVRAVDLGTHMSHHDELAVARALRITYDFETLDEYSSNQPFISSLPQGLQRTLFSIVNNLPFSFLKLAVTTTYAPLQFFLTQFFLLIPADYQGTLILGRLVSLIIGVFSIFLLYLVLDKKPESFLAITIMACSWVHIIASKTMYNYVSGPLAVLILFLLLKTRIRPVWLGLICIGLVLLHYQTLMFLPAFFIALILRDHTIKDIIRKPRILGKTALAGAIALIGIIPIYLIKLGAITTLHWSAGPHGEYAFAGHNPFLFFISNGWITLQNLFSFSPENTVMNIILTGILLASIILSLRYAQQTPVLFSLLSIATVTVFIIMGKLALGPTRHLLIMLPIMAFLAAKGVSAITSSRMRNMAVAALSASILITFVIYAPATYSQRQELFSEEEFTNLIEKYNVGTIIADSSTIQPYFVKQVTEEFTYSFSRKQNIWERECEACTTLYMSTYQRVPTTHTPPLHHTYQYTQATQEYSNRTITTTNTLEIAIYPKPLL